MAFPKKADLVAGKVNEEEEIKLMRWPSTEGSETVNIENSLKEFCNKGEQKNSLIDWRERWGEVWFSFVH